MLKFIFRIVMTLPLCGLFAAAPAAAETKLYRVGYIEAGEYWTYTETYKAIKEYLNKQGLSDKVTYPKELHFSPGWDKDAELQKAAQKLMSQKDIDLIIAAGTAATSAILKHNNGKTPVLAMDADADANLARLLGVETGQTIGDLREEVLKEIKDFPAGMSKAQYMEAGLHQIIVEADGFDLITMGRGEGAGCYCYLNNLIRKFSEDLAPSYPWMVLDNEAGLEHISRSLIRHIDALLIVVGSSPLSLDSARNIRDLSRGMADRISHTYVVTNMIKAQHKPRAFQQIADLGLEHLQDIPYDPAVEDMIVAGKSLAALSASPAVTGINAIIEKIGG